MSFVGLRLRARLWDSDAHPARPFRLNAPLVFDCPYADDRLQRCVALVGIGVASGRSAGRRTGVCVRSAPDGNPETRPASAIVRRPAQTARAPSIRSHRSDRARPPRHPHAFRQRRRGDPERCAGGAPGRRRSPGSLAPLRRGATSCGRSPAPQPPVHATRTSRAAARRLTRVVHAVAGTVANVEVPNASGARRPEIESRVRQ